MTGRFAFHWLTAALVLATTRFSWILTLDPTACALTNGNVSIRIPRWNERELSLAGLVRVVGRGPATSDLPLSAE